MSGIAGSIGLGAFVDVDALAHALAHRGRFLRSWRDTTHDVVLFERRALDAQPPAPVAWDGALLNANELRRDLDLTTDDARVLVLAAWQRWGEAALQRLEGPFAFVLWDESTKTLVAARDRLGERPLFFTERSGGLAFSSEVLPLLEGGGVRRVVDPRALEDYLHYGAIRQPRTILQDVRALAPGHMLRFAQGHSSTSRYYDLVAATRSLRRALSDISAIDAQTELRRRLEESARRHTQGGTSGAFLSGGLDSTAVVALMQRSYGKALDTFAVGFADEPTVRNELAWARQAAKHLGTRHKEVVIAPSSLPVEIERFVGALDQPSLDGLNTWFAAQAASQTVDRVFSGVGGDELFGGYPHFRSIRLATRLAPEGFPSVPESLVERFPARIRAWANTLRRPPEARLLALRHIGETLPSEPLSLQSDLDATQMTSAFELEVYLRDTLLRDADVIGMSHGVRIAAPLLHGPLVEFAFALPGRLKHTVFKGKTLFSETVRDLVPSDIRNRPKRGFELPLGHWLRTALRENAVETFASPEAELFLPAHTRARVRRNLLDGSLDRDAWALFILLRYIARHRLVPGDRH